MDEKWYQLFVTARLRSRVRAHQLLLRARSHYWGRDHHMPEADQRRLSAWFADWQEYIKGVYLGRHG